MDRNTAPIALWTASYEQAKNNCACSVTGMVFEELPIEASTHWQRADDIYTWKLSDCHTMIFNPSGPIGPVVLDEAAQDILNSFDQPATLTDAISHQFAQLGLLQPQNVLYQRQLDRQPGTLTAWLHVTNQCNLRCVYCYIEKTDETMNEDTGQAAVEAVFRSALKHNYRTVELKYAGGEAALNFKLVKFLHLYALEMASQTGLTLEGVVLSNGVGLSHSMLEFIKENDLTLMISLDGVGTEHDEQRVFSNGRGSFDLVAKGIDRAIKHNIQPHLSITVTGRSVDGVAKAVEFALDRDLLFNLNFYRDHDPSLSQTDLRAEDERLIAAMQATFAVIEKRLPRRSLIGSLVDRASFSGPHKRSCGAGHDYLVINHSGGVARCQMEINQTVTDVSIADPLAAIRAEGSGFQNLSVEEKEGCRECEWRYWCASGCSLLTYRVTGRNDVKSPYCNVYKALYPEVLRLEGLRLLKWEAPQSYQ